MMSVKIKTKINVYCPNCGSNEPTCMFCDSCINDNRILFCNERSSDWVYEQIGNGGHICNKCMKQIKKKHNF